MCYFTSQLQADMQERDLRLRGEEGHLRAHFFTSFFMNKLYIDDGSYNYANVRRWTLPKRLKAQGQVR